MRKEYQKEYMKSRRSNNNGSNKPGLTAGSNTFIDACGNVHNKDYKGNNSVLNKSTIIRGLT